MGLYFRKSVNLGGLRLNFSKSGIGLSASVRGARFGISPTGRSYVHCGRGGIYYRKTLSDNTPSRPIPKPPPLPETRGLGERRIIESGDTLQMVDSSSEALLAEIRKKHALPCFHRWFLVLAAIAAVIAIANESKPWTITIVILAAIVTPFFAWLDRQRKTVNLTYQLDPDYQQSYDALIQAFRQLCRTNRFWIIESEARVTDHKYHAGAGSSITRKSATPCLSLPSYFNSNITPPMLPAGRQRLYLFPDTILVVEPGKVGSVGYDQLNIASNTIRFIENESVPHDARQVDHTWQYVNKNGGPDRRFKDNRQLPIMAYGEMTLTSPTGLHEEFHVSLASSVQPFQSAVAQISKSRTRK